MHHSCIPKEEDFGDGYYVKIVLPENDQHISNILILLHGLGDTEMPYSLLGSRLNLPETLCLSVRGPRPLPFDSNGFHWGNDIVFDQSTGELEMDAGFDYTRELFKEIINGVLVDKCGWNRRAIFFLGFGQGGMAGLDIASILPEHTSHDEYGGVVSIGGPLSFFTTSPTRKARTPVLLIGAAKDSAITEAVEARVKNVFEFVSIEKWRNRIGDGMMKNGEEIMPIMRFFARRLRSLVGIPEGSVELSSSINKN